MFRIVVSKEEVLALDDYFTTRVGYIGHEGPDEAAHALADMIGLLADRIRKGEVGEPNENYSD